MTASDNELLRRAAEGDHRSFEQLVRRWEGAVLRMLSQLGVPSGEALDLCQETFLRVLTGGGRFRQQASFSTWLYRIVLNLVRDRARRHRPTQPLKVNLHWDAHPSPTDAASQREAVEAVHAALDRLPAGDRELLVLKHYGGLTCAEVAAVLGTPVSTTKSRLAAALQRLRAELVRFGIHQPEDIS